MSIVFVFMGFEPVIELNNNNKKYVFGRPKRLQQSAPSDCSSGPEFQTVGPATKKSRRP